MTNEKLKQEISERVTSKLIDITGVESELKVEIRPLIVEDEASIVNDNIYFGAKAKACSLDEATHLDIRMILFIDGNLVCDASDRFKASENVVKKASKLILSVFLEGWE